MARKLGILLKSHRGKNVIIGILAIALVACILALLSDHTDLLGQLAGTAGTPLDARSFASCLPTCATTDGKFLALTHEAMDNTTDASITVWVTVPSSEDSFEVGIFDGDSGRDNDGKVNMWSGNWDNTEVETTYTLFADPDRSGQGHLVVGRWHGNQRRTPMPNNDWYLISQKNVPEALNSQGEYSYRLECTQPAEGEGTNAFKLGSSAHLSIGGGDPAGERFAVVGMMATENDAHILYPDFQGDYENPGRSGYDGSIILQIEIPEDAKNITLWDGDFDRGSADTSYADTDDPNTNGKPDWAGQAVIAERAAGIGAPADDFGHPFWRRQPAVEYDLLAPDGTLIATNDNPSGTDEWEMFIVAQEGADSHPDLIVPTIPAGVYYLRIRGLDINNTAWLHVFHPVTGEQGDGIFVKSVPLPVDLDRDNGSRTIQETD